MKRVAIVADTHADEASRWAEHCRVMDWLAADIDERAVDLVAHCGDVWERRSTSIERHYVADWTQRIAARRPIVFVRGNHDFSGDVAFLSRLRAAHPIIADEAPAVHVVAGIAVATLPWPKKALLLAELGETTGEESSAEASRHLRNIVLGLGDELAKHRGPKLLAAHAMIDGARTNHDQPLVGADMNVAAVDLALSRADFVAVGHVHAFGNEWTIDGTTVAYPGSPRHCNFGEAGPVGYIVADFHDDGGLARWERIETPATPMLLIEAAWSPTSPVASPLAITSKAFPSPDRVRGAEIRLRFTTPPDQREAARRAADALLERMLADGAIAVRVEEEVVTETRARAPEIAAETTLRGKLEKFWSSKKIALEPERAERVISRASELEEKIHAL